MANVAKKKEYKLAAKQKAAEKLEEEYSDTVRDSLLFEETARVRAGHFPPQPLYHLVTTLPNDD